MNARTGLLAALLLSPGPAAAADRPCTCLAQGRAFELGERACLELPEGPRLAECRMVQNVTSWKVEGEGCVVSGLGGASRILAGIDAQLPKNPTNAPSVASGASSGR